MAAAVDAALAEGVERMVFGDLYLEDVRAYREAMFAGTPISPVFPLWGRPTAQLARQMIGDGLRAVLTCVDPAQVPAALAGRWYDEQLLADLPPTADPCGEHGEFHTFVVDGPGFARPLDVRVGEIVERDGFVFADVLPG
jgi:diphthamide synthase (EF-2-diphthine--ammonia ligase)